MSNWARTRFDKRKIAWGVGGALVASFPVVLWAHYYGPYPGASGAPKDAYGALACASSGCHTGNAAGGPVNAIPGSGVSATFSSGLTYTPGGPPVTITVTVTDPVNKKSGFQMSARTASGDVQAGNFSYSASVTDLLILCSDKTDVPQNVPSPPTSGIACPGSTPLQFIEQDYSQVAFEQNGPFVFTWTPPSTNLGNIIFYVAGNSVVGNGVNSALDHVSTAQYTMTPGAAPFTCTNTTTPVITFVDSASGYGGYSYFASGSWLEIKGTNLADAADPRLTAATNPGQWTASDFNGSNAPTTLDGISVSINGKPAYVWYLSTGQLNVQAPEDTTTGNVAITVTNCNATSAPFTFARKDLAPGFLAPTNYASGGTQYMVATFNSDGAYVLNTATGAAFGLNSRPAKPGDLIIAYGIGFGDVTPSILPGVIVGQGNTLVNPVTVTFGSTPTQPLVYQGLAGSFVGLYEFYITVPSTLANGDYPITVTVGGTPIAQKMSLTVHN
jgi:uncharacterized protein (TIGR03437 family)